MPLAPGDRNVQIEYMLGECEAETRKLSKWENSFIESIRDQFDRKKFLSDKQLEILLRIYEEKTMMPLADGEDRDDLLVEDPDEVTDPDEGPDNSDSDEEDDD